MTGKRYGAYHRVSQMNGRDPDADNYVSEKEAWKRIDGWGQMRGVEIAEHYLDRDQTGSKMDRPAFNRMLEDLRQRKIDGIAVAYTDRLSRAKTGDALRTIDEILEIAPGSLALLDLGVDPTTETGELLLTVLLALGRMQWRQYQRRWATAQSEAIDRGVWIGAAPFGYLASVIDVTKDGDPVHGPLEEDPDHGPVVREAFKVAAAGGLHAAMKYLEQEAPDKRWRTDEARRLLRNRVYLGETRMGELMKAGVHEPLTTVERFAAVEDLPEMTARPKRASGRYLLSGIARCECGAPVNGLLQRVHGREYRRYRCSTRSPGHALIRAEVLDEWVQDRLGVALAARAVRVQSDPHLNVEKAAEGLRMAESNRDRWALDDRARSLMGDEGFYAGLEKRANAVEDAREHYGQVAGQAARSEVLPTVHELEDPDQFQRALGAMVKSIEVTVGQGTTAERVRIEWTDEVDLLAPANPFEENAGPEAVQAGVDALTEGARRRR